MMELFVVMTLSFMTGTMLTSVIAFAVVFNKKVLKWYMKKVNSLTMDVITELASDEEDH